jgi:DNA-binding response OmpR family regulator
MKRDILLVEDDELFAESIVDFLEDEGFLVDLATTSEEALDKSFKKNYDLFLFDINLPDISGIELLKSLRENQNQTPTIFLTSYKDDETLKKCFINGCDDFLRKPVKIEELLLRIQAVLKRVKKIQKRFVLSKNSYYDYEKRAIFIDGVDKRLPLKVIQLLELFIEKNSSIITFDEINSHLWSADEEISEGSLRVYIKKLREAVGKEKIKNIKKIGYEVKL